MEATTTIIILASALTSSTTLASSSSLMTTSSSTFSAMLASTIMVSLAQGELKQFFLREPDNQTAIEGEQVTLPCRVENKMGLLQWTRDGFGLGDTRALIGYTRYRLVGSDDEKDWTLQIAPVLLEDDALFQCQVGAANGIKPVRSRNAQLTVYVPPEDPYIVQGSQIEVTEDREAILDCVSPGGKPAPDIYWHDGDGHVLVRNVRTSSTLLGDGKRFNTTSTVTFLPKKRHHNSTFTCSASNIADRSRRSASIHLIVRYAPSVRITTSQKLGLLVAGETVQFHCQAHANPPPETFAWFVDGQRANGFDRDFFVISNISQSYHMAIVKCEVTNEIGKSEETETLQVRYGPKMVVEPVTTSGDLGDSVSLTCEVDSNPPPTYTWTKGDSRQAVGSSQNLTVIVSRRSEGEYLCHSMTDGFPLLSSKPAKILLQGPPVIQSPQTQTGERGATVQVNCEAASAPPATGLMWTHLGRTISTGSAKYEILRNHAGFHIRSTLLIREATSDDFGYYGCTVTNSRGSDELSIRLEPQEVFPTLVVMVGVFLAIILMLLATLLFLLCRRKLCPPCPCPQTPDKPVKQNNHEVATEKVGDKTSVCGEDGWEEGEDNTGLYSHRLSHYAPEFPPKPDLISSGYVPYGSYVRDYPPGPSQHHFPPSDSQTSLHSASQLAQSHPTSNRHSTILNVSDPRYSATYGNPYLRSPPKTSHYSTFSPTEPPASALSPASTVNSTLSYSRAAVTPPLGNNGGGSVLGISPHSPSLHQRHPASGDLYAVVSRPTSASRPPPSSLTFRNTLTSSLALSNNLGTLSSSLGPLHNTLNGRSNNGINNGISNGINGISNGNGAALPRNLPPPLDQEPEVVFQGTGGDHGVQQSVQQGVHYILDAGPASDTGTHV